MDEVRECPLCEYALVHGWWCTKCKMTIDKADSLSKFSRDLDRFDCTPLALVLLAIGIISLVAFFQ